LLSILRDDSVEAIAGAEIEQLPFFYGATHAGKVSQPDVHRLDHIFLRKWGEYA